MLISQRTPLPQITPVSLRRGRLETVNDVRNEESDDTLDNHGLQYIDFKTSFDKWDGPMEVKSTCYDEMEELIRTEVQLRIYYTSLNIEYCALSICPYNRTNLSRQLRRSGVAPAAGTTVKLCDSSRY